MLTLTPGSSCDVCAEEYGPRCLPHSIPCGHVLCSTCCNTIVEKTSSRLAPVCPFCREQFATDTVRLIRTDFTTTGWSTPRPRGLPSDFNLNVSIDSKDKSTDKYSDPRNRAEARRLEDKVAKVASKKCSVDEVHTLHKELQDWLAAMPNDSNSALALSAALLRAILMNHLAHSEASRFSKNVESDLRERMLTIEAENEKFAEELRRFKSQLTQKSQECQTLRTELSRLKVVTTTLGPPATAPTPPRITISTSSLNESRRQSSPSPMPPSPSPAPFRESPTSPLSRHFHTRSMSTSTPHRSSTPSPLAPTPPSSRSTSSSNHPSNSTSSRSHTPAARSHTPSHRSRTPSVSSSTHRSHTPAPKISRSSSGESREVIHERWIPPVLVESPERRSGKPSRFGSYPIRESNSVSASPSRSSHRYPTVNSP